MIAAGSWFGFGAGVGTVAVVVCVACWVGSVIDQMLGEDQ
jgi:hypothetical protein